MPKKNAPPAAVDQKDVIVLVRCQPALKEDVVVLLSRCRPLAYNPGAGRLSRGFMSSFLSAVLW